MGISAGERFWHTACLDVVLMSLNIKQFFIPKNSKKAKVRGLMKRQQFYHSSPGYLSEHWDHLHESERWIIWRNVFMKMERNGNFTLHAFVMLRTHVHILFSTPNMEENFVMESLHQELKRFFQMTEVLELPLLSEKIDSYQQLLNTYRYIYRNPVEAGVVEKVEDYPYSSLFIQLGGKMNFTNVMDPVNLIQHPNRILTWLNQHDENFLYTGYRHRHLGNQMRL